MIFENISERFYAKPYYACRVVDINANLDMYGDLLLMAVIEHNVSYIDMISV